MCGKTLQHSRSSSHLLMHTGARSLYFFLLSKNLDGVITAISQLHFQRSIKGEMIPLLAIHAHALRQTLPPVKNLLPRYRSAKSLPQIFSSFLIQRRIVQLYSTAYVLKTLLRDYARGNPTEPPFILIKQKLTLVLIVTLQAMGTCVTLKTWYIKHASIKPVQ
jgi:hypothetical protein